MHEHAATISALPISTYRLQFHAQFTLRHALELTDYLARLGVTHVYASPILKARPGSTHGYDIVDHNQLNPELGTLEDFDAWVQALRAHGMGLILDIVPNHMGVGGKDNAWWLDTLEWGELSPRARFFDIDFKTTGRGLRGKVMIPVLGDQYGKVLQNGEMTLAFDAASGSFSVWYHDHRFPIDPRDYARIFGAGAAERWPSAHRQLLERFVALQKQEADVYEAGQACKLDLAAAAQEDPRLSEWLGAAAQALNGTAGDLDSWLPLHELLEDQSFRPTSWRAAADEINYRRFFNINDLAGVRVELPDLFEETHRLVLQWVREGKVQGLRIDHIDGLFDPETYCKRLAAGMGDRPSGNAGQPSYIVVEKILAPHERLPTSWPISGTTGYDTLNVINGIFVDSSRERAHDRIYRQFTGRSKGFEEVLHDSKTLIMREALASEMNVLASELHRLSSAHLLSRDFTLRSIRVGLEEVFAQMPVYRTYVTQDGVSEQDRRFLDWAIRKARKMSTSPDTGVFDFLEAALTGTLAQDSKYDARRILRVTMRAQQVSGPVMAKGMEDTSFYRYHRLISLNEVGGEPRRFGISLATFHRANIERLEHWPYDMLAGSTHDTKRGEDARARINVLSELPREWARQVSTWTRVNRSRRTELEGAEPMPAPPDEYLFYQSLVGAWPLDLRADDEAAMSSFADRVAQFMQKALREGKERSSWDNPNLDYERALEQFVREALRPSSTNPFPEQVAQWVARIGRFGAINSLSQTLLRLTIPGVPDTYRGCELWDNSLVDPDNRRPVDYAVRRDLLALAERVEQALALPERRAEALAELARGWKDGREKLYLIRTVLGFRRQHPQVFQAGSYLPLTASGGRADNLCAFARQTDSERVVVVVPRLIAAAERAYDRPRPGIDWADTRLSLPPGKYENLLTGSRLDATGDVPVAGLLSEFPVAVLVSR
jgi:(1->4)-alpha-D-glucan 1-alpha-D-glucosylmutase